MIFTILFVDLSNPIAFAASGESIIATPSDGSRAPITRISTFLVPSILETMIVSPGRYPTVFAKSPTGITPSSTTRALPSSDGLKDANKKHPDTTKITAKNFPKKVFLINNFSIFPTHP